MLLYYVGCIKPFEDSNIKRHLYRNDRKERAYNEINWYLNNRLLQFEHFFLQYTVSFWIFKCLGKNFFLRLFLELKRFFSFLTKTKIKQKSLISKKIIGMSSHEIYRWTNPSKTKKKNVFNFIKIFLIFILQFNPFLISQHKGKKISFGNGNQMSCWHFKISFIQWWISYQTQTNLKFKINKKNIMKQKTKDEKFNERKLTNCQKCSPISDREKKRNFSLFIISSKAIEKA